MSTHYIVDIVTILQQKQWESCNPNPVWLKTWTVGCLSEHCMSILYNWVWITYIKECLCRAELSIAAEAFASADLLNLYSNGLGSDFYSVESCGLTVIAGGHAHPLTGTKMCSLALFWCIGAQQVLSQWVTYLTLALIYLPVQADKLCLC